MASFSERMKSEAQTAWDTILAHRFFREIAEDAIEDAVFGRYLDIEYSFVDTAAAALGYAVAKAPSFRERRHLALGLHGLVTDQEQFFATAFEQIGRRAPKSGSPRPAWPRRCTASFLPSLGTSPTRRFWPARSAPSGYT